MNYKFTGSAQNALNRALQLAREMGHTYIGSEHILLGLLSEKEGVAAKLCESRGITFEHTRSMVEDLAGVGDRSDVGADEMTPRAKRIIETSAGEALKYGQTYIGTEHILTALLNEGDCVGVRLLTAQKVTAKELSGDIAAFFRDYSETGEPADGAASSGVFGSPGGGGSPLTQDKTLAGAPTLRQYGRDLTALARAGKLDPIIGRDTETGRVIQILSRRQKNNPCLIGEPGVGKTAVVEGLAQKIAAGSVPETLSGRSVVTLDIAGMIAGAKYRGEFEERMKNVMAEVAKNPAVILFIDEIHTIIGAGAAEGAVDAANILKPALARGEIQVIGATTIEEYRRHIEKDAALERRFQAVMVGEPSSEEAVRILRGLRDRYEAHHKVRITDEAIEAAVRLSRRYINDRFLPDKAIDLIDEAASRARIGSYTPPAAVREQEETYKRLAAEKEDAIRRQDFEGAAALRDREKQARSAYEEAKHIWETSRSDSKLAIGEDDIADIVTAWTGIPVSRLAAEEGQRMLNLESILSARVIGQERAVSAVARAIRRGRAGLKDPRRPMGSFIFLGPTGVGKTELSRALADVLFGDPGAMIRVDMSEYMEKHSVSKMIGSPPGYVGYDEGGQLTERIRRRPYAVVLFDEIEKAHPDVFNLLLSILDDGALTDSQGRRVDFRNAVIIMTSNVGASSLNVRPVGMGFSASAHDGEEAVKTRMEAALRDTFRPEFLNRIDEIIVFNRLTDADIRRIAALMLSEVTARIAGLGITISFDEEVISRIAADGTDEKYGARPLRREIQRAVEDPFSTALLENRFAAGDTVRVSLSPSGGIVFTRTG